MSHLRELYQEVILDHNDNPRNFGECADANRHAKGDNPLCGDKYIVEAKVDEDDHLSEVCFHGDGCAISKAAASMMTQHVKGLTVEEAEELIDEFRGMLTGDLDPESDTDKLDHLKVFKSVSTRPERIKCAVLAWHTLHAALEGREAISTEGDEDPVEV
jgi:nitrogen fixation NifU-like protein